MVHSKTYKIKEIFSSIQGEGFHTGHPAIFCRFVGCNLWSGLEKDRPTAACRFCDTNFRGMNGTNGGRYTVEELVQTLQSLWSGEDKPFIVFTGGEPLLQLDSTLIQACKKAGMFLAVETNGTQALPEGLDWVCVSPKPRSKMLVSKASEIKLIYPQQEEEMHPSHFRSFDAEHFYLQPMDNIHQDENTELTKEFCRQNPHWKLSIQTHKELGVP